MKISKNRFARGAHCISASLFLCLGFSSALSQTRAARPDRGLMPGGSYSVSDIENISLTNGNVNIGIPLASLPPIAGGKLGLTLRAEYNSKLWDTVRTERQSDPLDPATKYVVSNLQLSDNGGWRVGGGYEISFQDITWDYNWLPPPPDDPEYNLLTQNRWSKVVLTTPDGATHELRPLDYTSYPDFSGNHNYLRGYYKDDPNTVGGSIRYYSFDGSNLWVKIEPSAGLYGGNAPTWTLYLPDGTKVEQLNGNQTITDTNGNKVKIFSSESAGVFTTHYQDEQTSREIKYVYDPAGNSGQGLGQVVYQTVGGAWMTINVNFGSTHVQGKVYDFGDPVCADAGFLIYDQQIVVVRSIVFPQTEPNVAARQFAFAYNSDTTESASQQWHPDCTGWQTITSTSHGWGSLSRITMPTGAVVDYTYNHDGEVLFSDPDDAPRESLATKTLTHDNASDTWTYSSGLGGGGFTAPDGSSIGETMYPYDRAFAHSYAGFGGKEGLVYRTNTSNKVMVERHWTLMNFGGDNIAPGAGVLVSFNPVVDAEYTSLLDDTPSHNPIKISAKTFQYDFNGNLIQTKEYDWFDPSLLTSSRDAQGVPTGVPTGATLLREANNSYYNPSTSQTSNNVYARRSLSSAPPLILNAPQQTTAGPSIVQLNYDGQPYGFAPTAGNLSSKSVWDDLDNKWITTSSTYGLYGNLATTTDARGKVTQLFYDDLTHALPNRVTVDPQNGTGTQTSTTAFDYFTGLVTSTTDANGQTATIDYTNQLLGTVDPFGRPGVAIGPLVNVGGVNQRQRTRTFYEDSARSVTVLSDLNSEGDGLLKSQVVSDMLGRPVESRQFETTTSYIAVRKTFDTPNRISKTSNPFRSGETVLWTTTVADLLGRVVSITTPDNAVVSTSYNSNTVTVTDQAGKSRKSVSDALGRLIEVYEDPNGLNYQTSYDYDVLGNLRHVYQGVQTRTFTYDSLSRLRTAQNPESGAVSYQYDNNGNLAQKTDARAVSITYAYDALNRNTTVNYSDTTGINPDLSRFYDGATNGKGRLWYTYAGGNFTTGSNVEHTAIDSYDNLGRPLVQRQLFKASGAWGPTYQTSRAYNLAGGITSQTYPSGHTVAYSYDAGGRTNSFTGNLGDGTQRNYSTEISYSPLGGMTTEKFGTDTALYNKTFYNSRGQAAEIRVGTYNATDNSWWNRGAIINHYSDSCWGSCGGSNSTTPMTDNNGNLKKQDVYIPNNDQITSYTMWWQQYNYDALNRLDWVREIANGAEIWKQDFSYDRYGNRTIDQSATWGGGINNKNFTVNTANNRLGVPAGQTGTMSYDNAGNLTTDTYSAAAVTRAYDAENRMTSETQANNNVVGSYGYNADGQRVRRKVNGVETWQVYGFAGELLAEYAASGAPASPQKEYGYRNGQLLVTASVTAGSGGSAYAFTDDPLVAGVTIVKAVHLTDLRIAVNQARAHAGLSAATWAESISSGVTIIKASHITELRARLGEARAALGLAAASYTDPNLTIGDPIKAAHVQELRARTNEALTAGGAGGIDVEWLVADQLGTPRMVFDKTGALATVKRHDYLPFGEELSAGTGGRTTTQGYPTSPNSNDGVRQKFTQKERDIETGLDYFFARYYSSTQGRFTSPDEFSGGPRELFVLGSGDAKKQALPYAEITQPQSLNKYTYVYNSPCRFTDPDGHCGTPSGLKPGQVGICVASYIQSRFVPPGVPPGRGDGRGPNGQGGTSRIEVRVVVDPSKGTVTKTDEAMGTSGVFSKNLGPQGTGGVQVSNPLAKTRKATSTFKSTSTATARFWDFLGLSTTI